MLVHICCSVDSHYFLTRLKADFPDEKLIGFFYNPNIHPKSEYDLRLQDAQKSCKKLDIELLDGEYDDMRWFGLTKGLEDCAEKGERCEVCFDMRFEESAKKAALLGRKSFTSTLLQSPLKDKEQLRASLAKIAAKHGVEFVFVDYLTKGGMEAQNRAAKEAGLYRQNYCGCSYGLINQRAKKEEPIFESFTEIAPRALPASAEQRTEFYAKNEGVVFRSKIFDYRLLKFTVSANNKPLAAYPLVYSISQKESFSAKALFAKDGVQYLDKEGAKVVSLSRLNSFFGSNYLDIKELIYNPPTFEEETRLRASLVSHPFDVSPIFVLSDEDFKDSYKIELIFKTTYSAQEVTTL
ncbi:MAG TPA: epoxyqueuosine reductase QueH [Campylobacterales bacterium]|nr:epoxyqueuosine reductase QueH [Campylobacterales bacterium]